MQEKKLLRNMILAACLMLFAAGCSAAKPYLAQEGRDLVWLKQGEQLTAPASGAFLSDEFYQYQFDRCK